MRKRQKKITSVEWDFSLTKVDIYNVALNFRPFRKKAKMCFKSKDKRNENCEKLKIPISFLSSKLKNYGNEEELFAL